MPGNIQVFEENLEGEDFILTDVHGNAKLLRSFINKKKLKRHDRIILGGDVIDRGDSLAMCRLILEYKKRRENREDVPEICVVRGNHEDDFIRQYEKGFAALAESRPWVKDCTPEELKAIYDLFVNAPVIAHVKGIVPYDVVHADMPISSVELNERVAKGQGLDVAEAGYAMYARPQKEGEEPNALIFDSAVWNQRHNYSPVAYVGNTHDETAGYEKSYKLIREEENTVTLDINSPKYGAFLVVNHTRGSAEIYTDEAERDAQQSESFAAKQGALEAKCAAVAAHLKRYRQECVAKTAMPEIERVVQKLAKEEINADKTKDLKKSYLDTLRMLVKKLELADKKELAKQLLTTNDHFLAKESWWRWKKHSHQTKSIAAAMMILLGDAAGFVAVKDNKVSVKLDDVTADLTRHHDVFTRLGAA